MWLKEKEFRIKLGGQTFINVPVLIEFNEESLFTVRRNEETGEVGIDCDVYGADGDKIASIKRNNPYPGDRVTYDVVRSDTQITLKHSETGAVLVDIKKKEGALPVELDVSIATYLPDGRLLDAGPDRSTLGGLFMSGNIIEGGKGVGITVSNFWHGKSYDGLTIDLDGKTFSCCTFTNCKIVFEGKQAFAFRKCTTGSCGWEFVGSAKMTLDALSYLYRSGFKDLVEQFLSIIRGESK